MSDDLLAMRGEYAAWLKEVERKFRAEVPVISQLEVAVAAGLGLFGEVRSLARDIAALQSDIEAQIRIAAEEATRASELEGDAELWRAHIREVERVKDMVRRGFGPAAKEGL